MSMGVNNTVIFLPLDSRPCCCDFPARVGQMADTALLMPPEDLLDNLTRQADVQAVGQWLKTALKDNPQAGLVLSWDMLLWGGLVASRNYNRQSGNLEAAFSRIDEFLELLQGRDVYAYITVMRMRPAHSDPREAALDEQLVGFAQQGFSAEQAAARAGAQVGAALGRYLSYRSYRHKVNNYLLRSWVAKRGLYQQVQGPHSFLVFAQDDCKTTGLNVAEARELEGKIDSLSEKQGDAGALSVAVCPGTDEMGMLLLARCLAPVSPIGVVWSEAEAGTRQSLYEDRPLGQTLRAQAGVAGVDVFAAEQDPDAFSTADRPLKQLWIYAQPEAEQREAMSWAWQADPADLGTGRLAWNFEDARWPCGLHPAAEAVERARNFVKRLVQAWEAHPALSIAVADLSLANGGDPTLMRALLEAGVYGRLQAYAGWNTAGNALGTALSALKAARCTDGVESSAENLARQAFLLERFVDDCLYQSAGRHLLAQAVREQHLSPYWGDGAPCPADENWRRFLAALGRDLAEAGINLRTHLGFPGRSGNMSVSWPWQRSFEIRAWLSN